MVKKMQSDEGKMIIDLEEPNAETSIRTINERVEDRAMRKRRRA